MKSLVSLTRGRFIVLSLTTTVFRLHHATSTSLDKLLLEDIFPPSSDLCQKSSTSSSFSYQTSLDGWSDEKYTSAEKLLFTRELDHTDTNHNRTWTMRVGTGGEIYSFKGPFGEIIPSLVEHNSLWVDAVQQQVSVNTNLNKASTHNWFIHQAGVYEQADNITIVHPFFSPSLDSHCTDQGCSFGGWGQQAHIPTPFKSSILYFNRYLDCGDGVIEITSVIHNAADPDSRDSDSINWLNVPWGGVKTSVLRDILLSDADDGLKHMYPLQKFGTNEKIPYVRDTKGYAVFAQGLPIPPTDQMKKFSMPCSSASGSKKCLKLVIQANNACVQSKSDSNRTLVECTLEPTVDIASGCPGCHLYFSNEQTGEGIEVLDVINWSQAGKVLKFQPRYHTAEEINKIFFGGNTIDVGYSTSFMMPCADEDGYIQECPTDPVEYDAEIVKAVVSADGTCEESAWHSDKKGKYTVKLKLQNTRLCRKGCDGCLLRFINARTQESIEVIDVFYWAWNGLFLYFTPMNATAEEINSKFKKGDEIIVKNLDIGKPFEQNVGISQIFGAEPENLPPDYNQPTRLRFGKTDIKKDYTVYVHNPRVNIHPADTFVSRQYMIVDRLDGIEQRSDRWASETFKDVEFFANFASREIVLFSDGTAFGANEVDKPCHKGAPQCTGSTTPQLGMIAHYFITCQSDSYMGPDLYYFAPERTDKSQPIKSYVCKDQPGIQPHWKLLGFFPKGSCASLTKAKYDKHFCEKGYLDSLENSLSQIS